MIANISKEIKNKLSICIENHAECFKLVKDNKDIHVELNFLLSKLHKCKEDKNISQKLKHLIYLHAKIL